jgi:hypothetical protein
VPPRAYRSRAGPLTSIGPAVRYASVRSGLGPRTETGKTHGERLRRPAPGAPRSRRRALSIGHVDGQGPCICFSLENERYRIAPGRHRGVSRSLGRRPAYVSFENSVLAIAVQLCSPAARRTSPQRDEPITNRMKFAHSSVTGSARDSATWPRTPGCPPSGTKCIAEWLWFLIGIRIGPTPSLVLTLPDMTTYTAPPNHEPAQTPVAAGLGARPSPERTA